MTATLVLLFVGILVCFIGLRKRQAWAIPATVALIIIAVIVGAVGTVHKLRTPSPTALAMDSQAGAGRALGEAVAQLVPEGKILVLTYAPTPGEKLFTDARLEGVRMALTGTAYRIVTAGPQVTPEAAPPPGFVVFPFERLAADAGAWIGANADVKAVVSVMPNPPVGLQNGGRPFFSFAVADMNDWRTGLRGGGWKAAMITKPSLRSSATRTNASWQAEFDLVTPDTIGDYIKSTSVAP